MPKSGLKRDVAKKIKEFRLERGLTQEDAAEKSGFHYKYYQRIESGAVNLTLDSIEKLSRMLKIGPREFFP